VRKIKIFINEIEEKYPSISSFVYDYKKTTKIQMRPNLQKDIIREKTIKEIFHLITERKKHLILYLEEVIEESKIQNKKLEFYAEENMYNLKEFFLYDERKLLNRMILSSKVPENWLKRKEKNKQLIGRIEKLQKEIIDLNLIHFISFADETLNLIKKTRNHLLFLEIDKINVVNSHIKINGKKYNTINEYFDYESDLKTREKISKLFVLKNESPKENQFCKTMSETLERIGLRLDSQRFNEKLIKRTHLIESIAENTYEIMVKCNSDDNSNKIMIKMKPYHKEMYHKAEIQQENEVLINDGIFIKTDKELVDITEICNIDNLKSRFPLIRGLKRNVRYLYKGENVK
jgi:hypothetical protein